MTIKETEQYIKKMEELQNENEVLENAYNELSEKYEGKKDNMDNKMICNKCGEEKELINSVEIPFSYESERSDELHKFNLCDECAVGILDSFAIPSCQGGVFDKIIAENSRKKKA